MQCQDSELVKFASPLSDEQVSATPPSDEQVLDEAKFVWTKGRQRGASLFGTIQDFHTGLEARIGLPRTDLWKAMEDEHVQRDDSSLEFIPPNSKVSTSPEKEWRLANATGTHGSHELTDDWILETGQDGRRLPTPQTLENLYVCDDVQKAKLRKEEVIALILYTGPMYSRYNAVLRLFPEATVKTLKGNKYTTTIHLIVSGVIKLSRCFELPKRPEDRFVYRGLCNLDLPDAFKQPNEYNVTGGVEFGLMSTSLDRDVALEYARKGGKATIFKIRIGAVDRGSSRCPSCRPASFPWTSEHARFEGCQEPRSGSCRSSRRRRRSSFRRSPSSRSAPPLPPQTVRKTRRVVVLPCAAVSR